MDTFTLQYQWQWTGWSISQVNWLFELSKSLNTTKNEKKGIIFSKLFSDNKSINLIWVPSHYGINGNEQADLLARSNDDLD